MSDFLDYSNKLHQRITVNQKDKHISIDVILQVINMSKKVVMLSQRFETKLGVRKLTKKEICSDLGLNQLHDSSL